MNRKRTFNPGVWGQVYADANTARGGMDGGPGGRGLLRRLELFLDFFEERHLGGTDKKGCGALTQARLFIQQKLPSVVALASHEVLPNPSIINSLSWAMQYGRFLVVVSHTF